MEIDDVCRGCPGAMLGDCDSCSRNAADDDELTGQEREDDYRELCAQVEKEDGGGDDQ